jgi:thiosulfate reductase cytochrome b subunit
VAGRKPEGLAGAAAGGDTGAMPIPRARRRNGEEPVRVVVKHHALVRWTHWLNVPLLLGLIASGLSIYWAAPVFVHARDPVTHNRDYLVDLGGAIAGVLHDGGDARHWIYDHFSLGPRQLATALRLHWALAYFFMLNGALYALGLLAGGGWRALVPRASDIVDAAAMVRFYLGVIPMAILRRPWPHPPVRSKYNALQRAAYFSMPLFGALVVLSGWAMHKPVQLGWLERLFVNYDGARIVHFVSMLVLGSFVIPHVLLVIADGWDTFRSMVVGWSTRIRESGHE